MVSQSKVFVVGLVGGVASGKSRVAQMIAAQGGAVIDADRLGHDVLQRPLVAQQLTQQFGPSILNAEGGIDRQALSRLVFGKTPAAETALKQLEAIVHPQIRAEAVGELNRLRKSQPPPAAIVIDAPLLLEADWAPLCNLIFFVDTPIEVRRQRALQRGWSSEHFDSREQAQMSLDDKRRASTHIIDGTADESQLRSTLERLLSEMQAA